VRRERPDVIVTRGFNAEVLGGLAAVLTRTPRLVVWVHNCGDLGGRPRHRRLVDRLLAPLVDAVYGVAHGQVPYITEDLGYPAEKVRVVQNGADLSDRVGDDERDEDVAREFGIAPDEPIVGITAVLRTEKDHPNLLRAMRIVLAEQPRARLLVIGDGPERTATEKLAAELGLADRTVFTGYRDDVPRLLRGLDVFTLSSRIVECFPMALLESMAAARPAVCTAVGGIPEMIEEGLTGHVVPREDPEALAEGLLRVLRDPRSARAMGRAARERLEREFSIERSIREAEAALEETAGRVPA
jgi:glycosyltransferase involved in cell wall biosynthesis